MRGALVWGLLLLGCGRAATVGPFVTDIEEQADGTWRVTKCTSVVEGSGQTMSSYLGECTSKTVGKRRSAGASP